MIARKMEPVGIGRLERFVGDHGKVQPTRRSRRSIGKRVAVVGSGPAGLACAADLARAGVDVTVLEALHVTGGVLRYGIPSFRLPREIIDREIAGLLDLGVHIETDKVVGRTFTVDDLLTTRGFDAVFLGVGAGAPSFLGIPGENAGRVISANEFLTRVNLMGGDRFPDIDTPVGIGKDVVVIGAGNTAMDCLRVARRLGADVRCVYRRTPRRGPGPRRRSCTTPRRRASGSCSCTTRWRCSPTTAATCAGCSWSAWSWASPTSGAGAGRVRHRRAVSRWRATPSSWRSAPTPTPSSPATPKGLELDSARLRRGRPGQPGHQPARRVRRRRHRHRRGHGHPRDGRRPACGGRDPRSYLDATARMRQPVDGRPRPACARAATARWRRATRTASAAPIRWWRGSAPPAPSAARASRSRTAAARRAAACWSRSTRRPRRRTRCPTTRSTRCATAFEIELGGRDFYVAAAKHTSDEELHDMFQRLAEMEREHIDTLVRRYHLPPPDDAERRPASRGAAGGRATRARPTRSTCWSWRSRSSSAPRSSSATRVDEASPAARELYRELAAEEGEHIALLTTELAALRSNRRGLL